MGNAAQLVPCLPSVHESPNLIPLTAQKGHSDTHLKTRGWGAISKRV